MATWLPMTKNILDKILREDGYIASYCELNQICEV